MRVARGLIAFLCCLLAGACGSSASPAFVPLTPKPAGSPSPEVVPATMTLGATYSWATEADSMGDPTEHFRATVTSNTPVDVQVYVYLTIPGVGEKQEGCLNSGDVCFLGPDAQDAQRHLDVVWSGHAPRGHYQLRLRAPGFSDDSTVFVLGQDQHFKDWAGPAGARLAGNPLAGHPDGHPNAWQLQTIVSFDHR